MSAPAPALAPAPADAPTHAPAAPAYQSALSAASSNINWTEIRVKVLLQCAFEKGLKNKLKNKATDTVKYEQIVSAMQTDSSFFGVKLTVRSVQKKFEHMWEAMFSKHVGDKAKDAIEVPLSDIDALIASCTGTNDQILAQIILAHCKDKRNASKSKSAKRVEEATMESVDEAVMNGDMAKMNDLVCAGPTSTPSKQAKAAPVLKMDPFEEAFMSALGKMAPSPLSEAAVGEPATRKTTCEQRMSRLLLLEKKQAVLKRNLEDQSDMDEDEVQRTKQRLKKIRTEMLDLGDSDTDM
jgi:hypothetical protein